MKPNDLICDTDLRRQKIRETAGINGLDFVVDITDPNDSSQVTLKLYFIKRAPNGLIPEDFAIHPLEPFEADSAGFEIESVTCVSPQEQDKAYDSGQYYDVDSYVQLDCTKNTIRNEFVLTIPMREPPEPADGQNDEPEIPDLRLDPLFAELRFSLLSDGNRASELDCQTEESCPTDEHLSELLPTEINYLGRDYAGFRKLILDRLSQTLPDWQERHVPDIGIAVVEILAYVGDHLSYFQDAVATEAYLDTARQRISVRRHARLVDYRMHEGCSARTWLHLETTQDISLPAAETTFITGVDRLSAPLERLPVWDDLRDLPPSMYEVFEPLGTGENIELKEAHNRIELYTWGSEDCCLMQGSTSATLIDAELPPEDSSPDDQDSISEPSRLLALKPGNILIFEEVLGPASGLAADADLNHRHAVRLLTVKPGRDALYDQPIVAVTWALEDALPFDLCLSAIGPAPFCERITNVSVARGNVILVDHGQTVPCEELGVVEPLESTLVCIGEGRPSEVMVTNAPFEPELLKENLTYSEPLPQPEEIDLTPARDSLVQDPRRALPAVLLRSGRQLQCAQLNPAAVETRTWFPVIDLLASDYDDQHFMVEIDNAGRAHLRFGDGQLGQAPFVGERYLADYRVGKGEAGNVGAEAIRHIVTRNLVDGVTITPRNPLAAVGGVDPEPLADVKLFAPHAYRRWLERAIIADDYTEIVMRDFAEKLQAARSTITHIWPDEIHIEGAPPSLNAKQDFVIIAIDPIGQIDFPAELAQEVEQHLAHYRRIGHVVKVVPARYVGLKLTFEIHVHSNTLKGQIKAVLLDRLSDRSLTGGKLGFFHPDRTTFGQGVYLSDLVASIQAVEGVTHVVVTDFKADGSETTTEDNMKSGLIPLDHLEIVSFAKTTLTLNMEGGR